MGRHKQNKAKRSHTRREQTFLVMEERYDDGSTFRCQWPEASLDEYVHVILTIRQIAAERQISPHEAFLLVMHAKFPQLSEPEYVQEHACPQECTDWLSGTDGALDLFVPHQCPSAWDVTIAPA